MFMMEEVESPISNSSTKKDLALKASEKIKAKKTNAKPPSSSSESEGKSDSSEVESNEAKLSLLMKRTTRMLSKIGKKGYNDDPKKQKFRTSRRNGEGSKRKCYNCHTRFYKENRMHLTCAPGSIYTHMIDKTSVIPLQ
jgi:hypothetical protein